MENWCKGEKGKAMEYLRGCVQTSIIRDPVLTMILNTSRLVNNDTNINGFCMESDDHIKGGSELQNRMNFRITSEGGGGGGSFPIQKNMLQVFGVILRENTDEFSEKGGGHANPKKRQNNDWFQT